MAILKLPKISLPKGSPSADEPVEDVFEEMTLAEHLGELQSRIVKTCLAVGGAFVIGLLFASRALELVRETALGSLDDTTLGRFDVNDATEPITSFFKVALYLAIAIALPVIFYQAFAFIAPGLTRKEKSYVYGSLPFVVIFFIGGACFAFFLAIPRAFAFLSTFQSDLFEYSPTFSSIAAFYLQVSLGMGIAFELPILMFLSSRLGMVSPDRFKKSRRYAFVVVLVAAALITPTPDPFNMLFVAGPIYLLYEMGIIFATIGYNRHLASRPPVDEDEDDLEELAAG